jgi:Zn-dependent protease with chaperone function
MVNDTLPLPAEGPAPASPAEGVPARAFDGRSTQARAVLLRLEASTLHVKDAADPTSAARSYPAAQLQVGEAAGAAACPVRLPDGGTLWLEDAPLAQALRQAAGGPGPVARAIGSWPAVAMAVVMLVALLGWFGHSGAGQMARAVLPLVPESVDREIGDRAWASIDGQWLRPSRHTERCRALALRFENALTRFDSGAPLPELACRRTPEGGGFNAFALPNGQIVLLDGLVEALTDDQLMVVLGHELAHVRERHGMQGLMRQMGLLAVAGVALGDFSTIAAASMAGLQGLSYSREAEREADAGALRFMASAGLPPRLWAEVWQRFAQEEARGGGGLPPWMSSHPSTEERQRLVSPGAKP